MPLDQIEFLSHGGVFCENSYLALGCLKEGFEARTSQAALLALWRPRVRNRPELNHIGGTQIPSTFCHPFWGGGINDNQPFLERRYAVLPEDVVRPDQAGGATV